MWSSFKQVSQLRLDLIRSIFHSDRTLVCCPGQSTLAYFGPSFPLLLAQSVRSPGHFGPLDRLASVECVSVRQSVIQLYFHLSFLLFPLGGAELRIGYFFRILDGKWRHQVELQRTFYSTYSNCFLILVFLNTL